jgi:hypothetical protein
MKLICSRLLIAVGLSSTPIVAQQKTAVPAYFGVSTHSDSSKASDWTRIANQQGAVLAVIADSSIFTGLPGSCDPGSANYCGSCSPPCTAASGTLCEAACQFVVNHQAGQLVLGYQNGDFACHLRQTSTPGQVNQSIDNNWYGSYSSGQIQGIFVDDGPTIVPGVQCASPEPESGTTSQQSDYSTVYSHVHGLGGTVMLNATQFENSWIMAGTYKSADYALIFEQSYNTWYTNYKAEDGTLPSWWKTGYQTLLANIAFGTTQYDFPDAVTHSRDSSTYNSPVMYFFDGTSQAYDHLSCAFETQVALLQNQTPVPAAKTYCGSACTDLRSDDQHCGSCNNSCLADYTCLNGSCTEACDSNTCPNGCCDLNGVCRLGTSNAWCGSPGGYACDTCGATDGTTCRRCAGIYSCVPGNGCPP